MSLMGKVQADLEKRVSELEKQVKNESANLFGKSHSTVGSSSSDLILRCRGSIKIQWGNKFIGLIKDGKINVNSKFIFQADSVGVKDGIYVIGEGDDQQVILQINGTQINLKGEIGTTYVSFQGVQETNSEQKYTALQNIGFIYKSLDEVTQNSLQNGIIYVESEQKLYIAENGTLSEYSVKFPNPYTEQFVIKKSDSLRGSLLIVGSGIENSLAFDSFYLYSQDQRVYLDSNGEMYFRISNQEKLKITSSTAIFNIDVSSSKFLSPGATDRNGFRLYMDGGESTLEVDNLVVRNQEPDDNPIPMIYPIYWNYKNNSIANIERVENAVDTTVCELTLTFNNEFEIGQILYAYAPVLNENTETYEKLLIPLKVVDEPKIKTDPEEAPDENSGGEETPEEEEGVPIVYVSVIEDQIDPDRLDSFYKPEEPDESEDSGEESENPEEPGEEEDNSITSSLDSLGVFKALKGQTIFLVQLNGKPVTLLRRKDENIDLVKVEELEDASSDEKVLTRIGNLTSLAKKEKNKGAEAAIDGYGIYSDNSAFLKARYTSDYELPISDNSSKFASTEWVKKLLPIGTIIMFNGQSKNIPEGWAMCDGNNGTPNLIDKFIKGSYAAGQTGGANEVTLTIDNLPSHTHNVTTSVTNQPNTIAVDPAGSEQKPNAFPVETAVALIGEDKSSIYGQAESDGGNSNPFWKRDNTGWAKLTDVLNLAGTTTITLEETGKGQPFKILPSYYTLIYIMKISN